MKKMIYKFAAALSTCALTLSLSSLPIIADDGACNVVNNATVCAAHDALQYGLLSAGAILALVGFILAIIFAGVVVMKTGKKK